MAHTLTRMGRNRFWQRHAEIVAKETAIGEPLGLVSETPAIIASADTACLPLLGKRMLGQSNSLWRRYLVGRKQWHTHTSRRCDPTRLCDRGRATGGLRGRSSGAVRRPLDGRR